MATSRRSCPGRIEGNPDYLSSQQLHARAWPLVKPLFARPQEQALGQYRRLAGTGRATHDLSEIVTAARDGQVDTLLVAAGSTCWGHYDTVTGQVEVHDVAAPGDEDLVNLAAAHTLRHGRTVYTVAPEWMPEGAALAAVFFVPLAKH